MKSGYTHELGRLKPAAEHERAINTPTFALIPGVLPEGGGLIPIVGYLLQACPYLPLFCFCDQSFYFRSIQDGKQSYCSPRVARVLGEFALGYHTVVAQARKPFLCSRVSQGNRGTLFSGVLHPASHYRAASAVHSYLIRPCHGHLPVAANSVHDEAVGASRTPVGIHTRHVRLRVVALTSSGVQRRQHGNSAEGVRDTRSTVACKGTLTWRRGGGGGHSR